MGFTTKQVHAGVTPDPVTGAILTPIYQSTTFVQDSVDEYLKKGFSYSRSGNPTRKALETCIAKLEGGMAGFAFATGMAAETTVLMLLNAGDRVLVHNDLYGGTYRLLMGVMAEKGIAADWAAFADDWRALYQPAMEEVRSGRRAWTILDVLHRESLDRLLGKYGIAGLSEIDKDHMNRVWHRLRPWPDAVPGLERLKSRFIVGTLSNGNVEVGITDHAQGALGDLVFVDVPEAGKVLKAGDGFAVVESVKAASEVYAPVSGEVIEVNGALPDDPALINRSPTGDAWFLKLKLSNPAEADSLMDEAAYAAYVETLH